MPRLDVAPTRDNYLQIEGTLERVRQGHDLLEQKRQILITELMSQVEAAKRIKEEMQQTMQAAYEALWEAAVQSGITGLERQSAGVEMEHRLSIRSHSVMGVPVPDIECEAAEFALHFGITDGRSSTDEVMRLFLEALELAAELAEMENTVIRLAREVRRTQRRVNALEKIYIPQYKESLDYIEAVLAERQREEFVILRKVKRKREARAEVQRAGPATESSEE
ncbi:MAG: V-type ATP synthase subunit D [Planctomycetota bacterium]